MSKQSDEVLEKLKEALEAVKWNLPDSPEKFKAYQSIQEAILWVKSEEIFREMNKE